MNEGLEAKLEEYRVWALTIGHYSSSTVTRSVRRIGNFPKRLTLSTRHRNRSLTSLQWKGWEELSRTP